jgi:hypothetical protein
VMGDGALVGRRWFRRADVHPAVHLHRIHSDDLDVTPSLGQRHCDVTLAACRWAHDDNRSSAVRRSDSIVRGTRQLARHNRNTNPVRRFGNQLDEFAAEVMWRGADDVHQDIGPGS